VVFDCGVVVAKKAVMSFGGWLVGWLVAIVDPEALAGGSMDALMRRVQQW